MPALNDFVFASAAHVPIACGVLFPTCKDAQSFALSFSDHRPIVFLSHIDKAELQRCASAKIPALVEVHSMQGAFDVLKLSGVKFVLVNPLQNKATIDVAWMSVAKQQGLEVVFALHDLQEAMHANKARALEEFQKLSRLLLHYEIPFMIVSFAKNVNEVLHAEELEALRNYLVNEKLFHQMQLAFAEEKDVPFMDEHALEDDAESY